MLFDNAAPDNNNAARGGSSKPGSQTIRSPVQWYGGKGNMIKKLLNIVPPGGRPYVEPYMGGATLFFARDPAPVEVLNDLNGDLVNLFRCFQDRETFEELRHRLMWTPYARAELGRAIDVLKDANAPKVDRAWAFFVAINMGFSGQMPTCIGNWRRAFFPCQGVARPVNEWLMRLSMLDAFRWRLMMAQIDNRDALEVIQYWDNPDAVFYIDPPYHPETRITENAYTREADSEHHQRLVEILLGLKGAAVLSGYHHPVYAPLEAAGWKRVEWQTACHAAGRVRGSGLQGTGAAKAKVPRTEVAWVNKRAQDLLEKP